MGKKIVCEFCHKTLSNTEILYNHQKDEHRLLYIPMTEDWFGQLMQFLSTGNESILSEEFIVYLQKYHRKVVLNNIRRTE